MSNPVPGGIRLEAVGRASPTWRGERGRRVALVLVACTLLVGSGVWATAWRQTGASSTLPAAGRHYGINVEPSYRPWRWSGGANPDSWWDPASGAARVEAEMSLAAQLGVTYLRIEFPWAFMEPAPAALDWTRADTIVATARRYGVEVQPVIVYCPSWAGSPNCVPAATQFASFVTALVGRYHGSIHYWEMWNESDDGKYFAGSEQEYVANVLNPGYQAAKSVDAAAQVMVSGQYNTSQGWIDGLFAAGARFDVAAYHDYSGSADSANASGASTAGWLAARGFRGPLWLGEFGVQENGQHDTNQQAYFRGVIQSGNPSTVVMWYSLRDDDIYTGPGSVGYSNTYGLALHDLTRKEGFSAYCAVASNGTCSPARSPQAATDTPTGSPSMNTSTPSLVAVAGPTTPGASSTPAPVAPTTATARGGGRSWWPWLLAALGVATVVAAGWRLRPRRRS